MTPNAGTSKVTIGTSSPWDISVPQDDPLGWEETKCIICTSPIGEIKIDKIRIKQFNSITIDNCGWLKVRHLPNGIKQWHPAIDKLKGTEVYGDPNVDSVAWSVKFDDVPFNQLMFANEDYTKWVVAEKSVILDTSWYNGVQRTWLRSGLNPDSLALSLGNQYFRELNNGDPIISMNGATEGKTLVYAGNSSTWKRIAPYEAMYAFIREGPPTEFDDCLGPSGYVCSVP